MIQATTEQIQDIKDLVATGDVDLGERRRVFWNSQGRFPDLTDDQLIEAIACTDDDDDALFVNNVLLVEGAHTDNR